jgi:hypothetical protein
MAAGITLVVQLEQVLYSEKRGIKMEQDKRTEKIEYEIPKIVDLQIEQKNTQGTPAWCSNGSSDATNCTSGAGH